MSNRRYVISIDEELDLDRMATVALLGGKGAGLAEMRQVLGLPVPPAVVVTTEACRASDGGSLPDGLSSEIGSGVTQIEAAMGRGFGDPKRPLLVSVRSGAPVSMPGMMDTILNVGINPTVRDGLAAETGDEAFAANIWMRFCSMYAELVVGMPAEDMAAAIGQPETSDQVNDAADRLRSAAEGLGGIPLDPRVQLDRSVEAVFRSWNSDRARVYRQRENISDDLGTAVTVQAMVFGNADDESGTGVLFTRNPATGDAEPYGDYLPRAQGEDVVSGTRPVLPFAAMADHDPGPYRQLIEAAQRLEHHYRDMCDIEFTISSGELFLLQTRIGKRSPEAAVRIAVAMAEDSEFPLSKAEAVARISHPTLTALANLGAVDPDAYPMATGIAASPGVGVGQLSTDPDKAAELGASGEAVVLVRAETSPADVHGMIEAKALVTSLGGAASHAAVVARGWGIPAVTGASTVALVDGGITVNGDLIAEGELITVDGSNGTIYAGDCRVDQSADVVELDLLRHWARDLGRELGEPVGDASDAWPDAGTDGAEEAPGAAPVTTFEAVRALQLKGMGTAETVAEMVGANAELLMAALKEHDGFVTETPRGLMATPEARAWLADQMAAELASIDTQAMNEIYGRFMVLNHQFKLLVTTWQTSDQTEDDQASTQTQLAELNTDTLAVVAESMALAPRLAHYERRFAKALDGYLGGDQSMLASPLKDSYHTVWFEYHEELIHLSGRNRKTEEA